MFYFILIYSILIVDSPRKLLNQQEKHYSYISLFRPVLNSSLLKKELRFFLKNTDTYIDHQQESKNSQQLILEMYSNQLINLYEKRINIGNRGLFIFLYGNGLISKEALSQSIFLEKVQRYYKAENETNGLEKSRSLYLTFLNNDIVGMSKSSRRFGVFVGKIANLLSKASFPTMKCDNLLYKNDNLENLKAEESFEERDRQVKWLVNQLNDSPTYFPFLNFLVKLQVIFYLKEGKYQLALQTYFKIKIKDNHNSFSYLLNPINIGDAYQKLGSIERLKLFFKEVIFGADLNNNELSRVYQLANFGLGSPTQKSYLEKVVEYFKDDDNEKVKQQKSPNESRIDKLFAIFETMEDEEPIKNLSVQNQHIEKQNFHIKLLFVFSTLSMFLAIYYFLLSNRLKKNLIGYGKLFAIIAHDLRSPLNAYMGLASEISFLIKNKRFDRLVKISNQIDYNAQRINLLLNNLFNWSKVELEISNPKWLTVDIIPSLNCTLEIYRNIAENKPVSMVIDLPESYLLTTDTNLFLTIIRNLVDNAIKNCGHLGTVSVVLVKENGKSVLKISNDFSQDNPPDFSAVLQIINDRKTYSYGENGIGMGLLLVKEFASKLHLPIHFIKDNKKVTFEIYLD
jgi:signal transduction histidine kinase